MGIVRGVKTHTGAKKRWVPFGKEKTLLRHHAGGQHLVRAMGRSFVDSDSQADSVANFHRKTRKLVDYALDVYNDRLPEHQEKFTFDSFVDALDAESVVVNRVFDVLVREVSGAVRQRKRTQSNFPATTAQVVQRRLVPNISTVHHRDPNEPLIEETERIYFT
ncbi:Schizosaccharomyces specific protein [Schizosaccharomyces osmophilus]|uniref:Schizosaccharomyces specific protein n=1 Tax=Schizosaccharomyces osmophilus TaxID=2545709 RepID=A0AAE9W7I1_9SCHI|nr:Schizosaccharomyces specific protein [Schizosaccharomyces osmophilus]WBW70948.1 Schizosaccharomyces specific protein [Schizosaccharomyces osmophilus]